MQAEDLKGYLLPLVTSYLGTYTPLNIPAVNIGIVPMGWVPTGLELVIDAYPTRLYIKTRIKTEVWNFRLNQYDETNNNIYAATKAIQDGLVIQPDVTYVQGTVSNKIADLSVVRSSYFTLNWREIYYIGNVIGKPVVIP